MQEKFAVCLEHLLNFALNIFFGYFFPFIFFFNFFFFHATKKFMWQPSATIVFQHQEEGIGVHTKSLDYDLF